MDDAELPAAEPPPALPWLIGARVQRIDSPVAGLFSFTLYDRGNKHALLLSVQPQRLGVGQSETRPTGLAASAFVRRLRVAIENGTLTAAEWLSAPEKPAQTAALQLTFTRKGALVPLIADFDPQQPNLFLLDELGHILGASDERARRARFPDRKPLYTPSTKANFKRVDAADEAAHAGARLVAHNARTGAVTARDQARTQAKASLKKVARRLAAIEGDLARALEAPTLRREGNALLCHLHEVPVGATQVSLVDPASDGEHTLLITLDPALSAQQNAERKFTRARRLERGIGIARERLAQAQQEADRLTRFLASLDVSSPESLHDEAAALRIPLSQGEPSARAKQRGPQVRVPYRTFEGSNGALILVGKGAVDNDTLTLTVARPHDTWLHARGVQGAHVIVPTERNAEPPPELLLDAAHLAAHFSDVRGEALTEVQHTQRRYLRKPKGSAPGAVRVDRERVLLLRLQPERLQRLLANERTNT